MAELAAGIAALHEAADIAPGGEDAARMGRFLDINARAFAATVMFSAEEIAAVEGACRAAPD
jgi:hypothetical protein